MAHTQKPNFVFRAKRTSPFKSAAVRQFSRLLAVEVCASAVAMRSEHNTVDKKSTEQITEQCQHPGEGTHIHVVEQVRPQGTKKHRTKQHSDKSINRIRNPTNKTKSNFHYVSSCQEKFSYWKRTRSVTAQQQNFTQQYGATVQRAIPVENTQLFLSNRRNRLTPNISDNTTAELTVEYPVIVDALLRKNF